MDPLIKSRTHRDLSAECRPASPLEPAASEDLRARRKEQRLAETDVSVSEVWIEGNHTLRRADSSVVLSHIQFYDAECPV